MNRKEQIEEQLLKACKSAMGTIELEYGEDHETYIELRNAIINYTTFADSSSNPSEDEIMEYLNSQGMGELFETPKIIKAIQHFSGSKSEAIRFLEQGK